MSITDDLYKFFLTEHDTYSLQISWHQQHLIETILDLQSFIHSISTNLENEQVNISSTSIPFGYFHLEQPYRINYIHIIFLFSILERRIRALINLSIKLATELKDLSEYKGSFIERTKSYMNENLEIDISSSHDWSNITTLQKIRDCIIHCGGNINESRDKNFFILLSKQGTIEINHNGYLKFNDTLCTNMGECIVNFLNIGLENLYEKIISLKNK